MPESLISQLLSSPLQCVCGKTHSVGIKKVLLEDGAIEKIPSLLVELHYAKPFIVDDVHTFAAAGDALRKILNWSRFSFSAFTFADKNLIPDENALGRFMLLFDSDCDVILAVGSGTINDLCRFAAFRLGKPFISVPTAPSMDGISSAVAPLISGGLKVTFNACEPTAIVADTNILRAAPAHMIAAGAGDILGKYTCLCDWDLSHIINGEYYCPYLAKLVKTSIEKVVSSSTGLGNREAAAIQNLTEALILSGIVISFAGNSRPASGCEHHLSHFWEMRALFAGKIPALHGAKVGFATLVMLDAAHSLGIALTEQLIDEAVATPAADYGVWETEIRRVYGIAADEVLALEKKQGKNAEESRQHRLFVIKRNLPHIRELLLSLPQAATVRELLLKSGGPVTPDDLEISSCDIPDALLYAKELRGRYTILQLLWDTGMLKKYAKTAVLLKLPYW